jgi:pimeloyl-ACP methyl ester carboxylesterase
MKWYLFFVLLFFFYSDAQAAVPGFERVGTQCLPVLDNAQFRNERDCYLAHSTESTVIYGDNLLEQSYIQQNTADKMNIPGSSVDRFQRSAFFYVGGNDAVVSDANCGQVQTGRSFWPHGDITDDEMKQSVESYLADYQVLSSYAHYAPCMVRYYNATSTDYMLQGDRVQRASSGGSSTSTATTTATSSCAINCYSSILFLPGIMGSRLYAGDTKLWDTFGVFGDEEQQRLAMDANGYSVNNVHTTLDTVGDSAVIGTVATQDIYKSFIGDLQKWKNTDQIIQDYRVIPYDWRLPLDQIVQKGKQVDNKIYYGTTTPSLSDSFIVQQLSDLQKDSRTGKVTIIAHSNGGLVTKELIQTLKEANNPLYDQIDKVIFVAVPQVGTPEAVLSILHGKGVGYKDFDFIINQKRMRQLAENMPMSYNLLPNQNYLDTLDSYALDNKVVTFDDSDYFKVQQAVYGNLVNNQSELQNFITGSEGRYKPTFTETTLPNVGNDVLYSQANTTHQRIDNFELASSTKLVQVAGWGEDTVVGIDYKSYLKDDGSHYPSFKVRKVVDGDGTVVVPSALYTSTSNSNVERWWVDLSNNSNAHATILEIPELRSFIQSHIQNQSLSTNQILKNTQPTGPNIKRLHYTLHSPLTLGVVDTQGRYTGMSMSTQEIINQIEGVNYDIYGEVQTVSVPVGLAHTVVLDGYETGSFSLDIDKQEGNTVTASTTFSGIPTTADTIVKLAMNEAGDIASSTLQIDLQGDGTADTALQARENATVTYQALVATTTKPTVVQVSYGGGGGGHHYQPPILATTTQTILIAHTPATTTLQATTPTKATSSSKVAQKVGKKSKENRMVKKPITKAITQTKQVPSAIQISQVASPAGLIQTQKSWFDRIKERINRIINR